MSAKQVTLIVDKSSGWDRKQFLEYLVKKKKLSDRVASNYVSRCNRVEKELFVQLIEATKSEKNYVQLMQSILDFACKNTKTVVAEYALAGTLRLAVRCFAEYQWGNVIKSYPRNYRLTRTPR